MYMGFELAQRNRILYGMYRTAASVLDTRSIMSCTHDYIAVDAGMPEFEKIKNECSGQCKVKTAWRVLRLFAGEKGLSSDMRERVYKDSRD